MSKAIQKREETGMEPANWAAMREQAAAAVASGFLPKAVNTPEKAIALALAGRELGLPMMQSIRSLHIIDGKPTMSADLMMALALQRVPGCTFDVVESTEERCTVSAARPGGTATEFAFTMEDAKRAGLLSKDNWKKYPRAMLRSRAVAEAARAKFPDALMGAYTADELGATTTEDAGEVVQAPVATVVDEAPQVPAAQIDDLVIAYTACTDEDTFGELEASRRYIWSALGADDKRRTKAASDDARERLDDALAAEAASA